MYPHTAAQILAQLAVHFFSFHYSGPLTPFIVSGHRASFDVTLGREFRERHSGSPRSC
jgi:hypothetical protein